MITKASLISCGRGVFGTLSNPNHCSNIFKIQENIRIKH